jgi:phosphohistidine phosphatase
MKRLILMRHAKSDWRFDQPDHDRPLNPRGIRSARALGDWLRAQGHVPDSALVSTSLRTRETWGLLGLDQPARFEPTLYHAEPAAMLALLAGANGDKVLLLGHNPGIAALAQALVTAPPDDPRFADYPTGATTVMALDIAEWRQITPGMATVQDFVIPRALLGE